MLPPGHMHKTAALALNLPDLRPALRVVAAAALKFMRFTRMTLPSSPSLPRPASLPQLDDGGELLHYQNPPPSALQWTPCISITVSLSE